MSTLYPKVTIKFCIKCKWHNRAIWYVQEILQTFPSVGEVSLQPTSDPAGLFEIQVAVNADSVQTIYKRKFRSSADLQTDDFYYDGFPDAKLVKGLVKRALGESRDLGHSEGGGLLNCGDCAAEDGICQVDS
ncbi:uncharacterized protein KQ657_002622 [Scheffersomyces spartinae]|uniref:Rdx family-domain-containing protein n=1 Tax=Scheffersomyces spartinae TaxID=45513 RepID=A0A9P7V6B5_9ASCO|nr:uncharacterized protein KQ657_002622 [Scheffersomyces spartinae]KAG7192014.1 hypothetical protein KQ657_002622 [Scheffersomyces spartinae]